MPTGLHPVSFTRLYLAPARVGLETGFVGWAVPNAKDRQHVEDVGNHTGDCFGCLRQDDAGSDMHRQQCADLLLCPTTTMRSTNVLCFMAFASN